MRAVARTIVATMPDADTPNPGNPIHSSDSARDYGFRAALVGGATIYGWCVPTIIDAAGTAWLDHGWADVAFRRPVFPNDRLELRIDADGSFEVRGDVRVRISKVPSGAIATVRRSFGNTGRRNATSTQPCSSHSMPAESMDRRGAP